MSKLDLSLAFRLDDRWVPSMREKYQVFFTTLDFGHVLFTAQVSFQAGDTVLLDCVPTPLYWIAAKGLRSVTDLENRATTSIDLRGTSYRLVFRREGDNVAVTEEAEDVSAVVPYADLLNAWTEFAKRVRTLLVEQFPEILSHPGVGAWFRGEED